MPHQVATDDLFSVLVTSLKFCLNMFILIFYDISIYIYIYIYICV